MSQDIPSAIALFDYSHAIAVAFHGAGPEQTGDTVIQQLAAMRSSLGPNGRVVLCLDSKPYHRTTLFDGYKAGRKAEPELQNIWERTLARITAEGYAVARAPGAEADDVMATLALLYAEAGCSDVRLVTADKDIAQCLRPGVRWFVPQLGKRDEFEIRDADWVVAHFGGVDWAAEKQQKVGPTPAEVPLVQAICGDVSDRIPGVKGIGIKGAVALVKTYGTPEGMAGGLVAEQNSCKMKGKDLPAFWRNFALGMVDIPKWLKLTTLDTDVDLELHPLKYLERVEPKPLVQSSARPPADDDDIERAALQGEIEEEFPGEPSAEDLEEERRVMAASLPVEPARTVPAGSDDGEYRAAEQRSCADRQVAYSRAMTPAEHDAKREAFTGEASRFAPSKYPDGQPPEAKAATRAMVIGKDPKADEALRKLAEANTNAPKTPERVAEVAARIEAGNAAERASAPKSAPPSAAAGSAPAPSPDTAPIIVPSSQGPSKPATSALAVVAPPSWALAVQPKTVDGMMWMAEKLYNARQFSAFGSVEGTFAIMSFGRELGMGVMQSLMSFCEVKGKPFMWAHAMRGKVLADPRCEYLINTECTSSSSTWVTRRRGWPEGVTSSYTFTYAEAENIGLTTGPNRDNWQRNPRSLVDKTASSRLIRQVYADILWGIHCPEEE